MIQSDSALAGQDFPTGEMSDFPEGYFYIRSRLCGKVIDGRLHCIVFMAGLMNSVWLTMSPT